jgi:hypothetical protein
MHSSVGSPRGQILIITAFAFVVLIAIAAVVVDLGFSWMLARQEQNAADPGSIAAARWLKDPDTGKSVDPVLVQPQMDADGCFYAQRNGFFTGDAGCADALDSDDLQVLSPPVSGAFSGFRGYAQVIIRSSHPTFFARIWGQDEAFVVSSATAANTAGDSYSAALHALDPTGCHSGQIGGNGGPKPEDGTAKVTIEPLIDPDTGLPFYGGFVQVNSSCDGPVNPAGLASCPSGDGALKVSGGSSLDAPAVYTYGDCALSGSGATITTDDANLVHQGTPPVSDPLASLIGPRFGASDPGARCGDTGLQTSATVNNHGCGTGGAYAWKGPKCADDASVTCVTLNPGIYYGGWDLKTDKYRLLMNPGIYIIAGGGIKQTGSAIQAVSGDGDPTTAQVLIYGTDNPAYADECKADWAGTVALHPEWCQGAIDFTAGGSFRAFGIGDYACSLDSASCPYKGLLLWQEGRASCPLLACPVSLGGGTAALNIGGTIYAPTQLVVLEGSSATSGDVAAIQIISYDWKIVGNSEIFMPYDPRSLLQLDQRGLVE